MTSNWVTVTMRHACDGGRDRGKCRWRWSAHTLSRSRAISPSLSLSLIELLILKIAITSTASAAFKAQTIPWRQHQDLATCPHAPHTLVSESGPSLGATASDRIPMRNLSQKERRKQRVERRGGQLARGKN